jgi:hypothetical protein
VEYLDEGVVHLKGGDDIKSDAILCGTGWKPDIQFFDEEAKIQLGLPHDPEVESITSREKWARLDAEADKRVLVELPLLAKPPPHQHKQAQCTPYRLYRGMIPIHDDSIVFITHTITGINCSLRKYRLCGPLPILINKSNYRLSTRWRGK